MELNVLITEDEVKIASLMESFLQTEGYDVLTAMDGKTAFQLFTKHKPDIVPFKGSSQRRNRSWPRDCAAKYPCSPGLD